ncbi:thyrotropin-releasing hormone receptor-like [Hemiscyllium ocellatum]|uniref:thyrotropin-releasing hormone receptor-like n=1 Tax=Hemiscyllium ocellatum TaxID=170820 RepID=UPI0029670BBF|nr:thyrotropin-releasing hormone receptor-like [Hemiscyllium ocellatum]
MAVSDLTVIVTAVILNRVAGIYFPFSFLSITPVCSLRSAINYGSIDCSTYLTVAFTIDRFIAICCPTLKITYCTRRMAMRIVGIVITSCCIKNVFLYFIYEPRYMVKNIPWFCNIKDMYFTSLAWTVYEWIFTILSTCLPFILILLPNVLTVRSILVANGARTRLQNRNIGKNQSDAELEKRKKSIVLLFAISGSFFLFNALYLITIMYVRIGNLTYASGSDFNNLPFVLNESAIMLQFLSTCINPFIYAGTQNKFRAELNNLVQHPWRLLLKKLKI